MEYQFADIELLVKHIATVSAPCRHAELGRNSRERDHDVTLGPGPRRRGRRGAKSYRQKIGISGDQRGSFCLVEWRKRA